VPADNPQTVPAFQSSGEVEALITEFERGTLPPDAWNHRAHLATGVSYLRRHGALEGAGLMRGGIQRYNRRVGIGAADEGAYNETLTLFWLHHVWDYLRRTPGDAGLLDLVNAFVAEYGPQPDLALEHYSEAVLWSTAAKKEWVEPDLRALSPKAERPPFLPSL
jgi:hypothetical protein